MSVVLRTNWEALCISPICLAAWFAQSTYRHLELLMNKLLYGRRVLVVEDEMLVLLMTEGMLADLGCESIVSAATVDQALALIDGQALDAALLDINLNGNNTHPVADALATRGVPFAFVTGYSGVDIRECDRERPLLKKPFEFERLAEMLTGLIT